MKYAAKPERNPLTPAVLVDTKASWEARTESTSKAGSNTRTLTRTVRASTHGAPTAAHGQSTSTAPFVAVMMMLSARTSVCAQRPAGHVLESPLRQPLERVEVPEDPGIAVLRLTVPYPGPTAK